ncbi:MAG: hypothetical protein ACOYN5_06095 [Bacteroidales bacterium]
MRIKTSMLLPFVFLIFLSSCGSKQLYDYTETFEKDQWNRFAIIEKEFEIQDITSLYDLKFEISTPTTYPYDYLAMNITVYLPDETMRSREVEIRLQDKSLHWLGKEKTGVVVSPFTYMKGFKLNTPGKVRLRIENKMSKLYLENIRSIRLMVEKAE